MLAQESPGFMGYSIGGNGVQVASGVGDRVMVGVSVIVGLAVGEPVGKTSLITSPLPEFNTRKMSTAPKVKNKASNPNAAGKLRVISGNRFARISDDFLDSDV